MVTLACPSEAEEVVANLQKYQEVTRAWRDLKVKLWDFVLGNLVLLQSPHTESTGKVEAKRTGPYVVTEKMRSGT
jgi:hypothetical protein